MAEYIVPIATALVSVGSTTMTSYKSQQRGERAQKHAEQRAEIRQKEAEQKAWERYQEASKPDPEALKAAGTQYRGQLGQAKAASYKSLASQLAARGFGSGSGLGVQSAAEIEKGYLRGLGEMGTELTKYSATPMFGPPSSIYPQSLGYIQPMTGATEAAAGAGQSSLNQALGYYMAQQYDQRNRPGTASSYVYSPSRWDTEDYGIRGW